MRLQGIFIAALGSMLAACVSAPPPALSVAELNTYRVAAIHVTLAPGLSGKTTTLEAAFARSKGIEPVGHADRPESVVPVAARSGGADYFTIANSAEALAYYDNATRQALQAALQQELGGALLGARPARLDMHVTRLVLPNEAMRILVSQHHVMVATVTLKDATSGATLAAYPELTAVIDGGGGLVGTFLVPALAGEPAARLGSSAAKTYRNWLLRN